MKSKINKRHLIGLSFIICHLSFGMMLASCSDWDDHYEADASIVSSQRATLWENINSNGNLSQFASLLKKGGYDAILNESQTYTVWAPLDGTYDFDVVSALNTERLQKEFIQNHIARNNYPISGKINERILTLNEKLMHFTGPAYNMEGIDIGDINLASSNGVMHTLKGKLIFMQNIYESLNNNDYPLDSVSAFIHSYDVKKLNEDKSVVGPTVNGEITYLDSVFDEHNELFNRYYTYINREDSNYTMLVPTNEAWIKAKNTVSQYFNYLPEFEFMENTSTTEERKEKIKIKDVAYLKDSIVNMMLTRDLFFNNNIYDNKKLNDLKTGETLQCDSLYGTTLTKFYTEDAAALFANATRINKSNGAIWITDSLHMRTWTSWNPELKVEAEDGSLQASYVNVDGTPERVYVVSGTQNTDVPGQLSNNNYVEVKPVSQSTNPGIVFYLPDVRSTTYSLYIVMVPANIMNASKETKPNQFRVTMGYANENGVNKEERMKSPDGESTFTNDTLKIDTVYVGDFTFPMAYAGTGSYFPYIRVNSSVTSRERANFDRTLRIDCIILRPKELDNYLKEHPDYKYDNGNY